jgi:hypothetical protein
MTDFKKHQAECCRCLRQLYSQLHGTVKQVDHLSQGVQGWPEQQNKTLSLKKKKKVFNNYVHYNNISQTWSLLKYIDRRPFIYFKLN